MSYSQYLKERIIIGIKTSKEYKANFWVGLISHLFFTLSLGIAIYIVINVVGLIDLTLLELIFLMLHAQTMAMFFGLFRWGNKLQKVLLAGDLNSYLTKPRNTFIKYFFDHIPYFAIPYPAIDFLLLLLFSLYFGILDVSKYLIIVLLSIPGGIFFISIFRLFDSFAFFMKENKFLVRSYYVIERGYEQFPVIIFKEKLYTLGFFVGHSLYGIFPVLYYFDKISLNTILEVYFYVIPVTLLLLVGMIVSWKIGLKKYEAFG